MSRNLIALAGLMLAILSFTLPAEAQEKPLRVLYLDQSVGFVHGPVNRQGAPLSLSETAIIEVGKTSGAFTAQVTQDARDITPERLKTIDVLVFYTTGALPISAANWQAIQTWVASGKGGFVGLHSATDTGWDYSGPGKTYTQFISGKFAGHPWNERTPIRVTAQDTAHPTVAMWPAAFDYAEEIYQYSDYDPGKVRVLQSLDFTTMALKRPYAVPLAWVRKIGKGRLFYTNLGHNESTWNDARYRAQIVEGVKWAAGRTKGGSTAPNPREQSLVAIHSLLAYAGASGAEIDATVSRLGRADTAWLNATAKKISDLRGTYPAKADSDRTRFDAAYLAVLADVREKVGP